MKALTALLAAILVACIAPVALADAQPLRCSDGTNVNMHLASTFQSNQVATQVWVNDSPGSLPAAFIAYAGTIFAPDGTVIRRWENPAANPHGFINCFGEFVQLTGKFTPQHP